MIVTERMAQQFAAAASRKLGVPVTLHHWEEFKTGAAIPVFLVPADVEEAAQRLGLWTVTK